MKSKLEGLKKIEKPVPARMESPYFQKLKEEISSGESGNEELDTALKGGLISSEDHHVLVSELSKILEKAAITDPLTGLLNRRTFIPKINKLRKDLNESVSKDQRKLRLDSILVVSVDLEGLKFFNEKPYSHDVGNKALIIFTNKLKEVLRRDGDSAFRLGGDEFALVLPIYTNSESAEKLYARIQKEINKLLHLSVQKVATDAGMQNREWDLLIRATFGHAIAKRGDLRTVEQLITEADTEERNAKDERNIHRKNLEQQKFSTL
ncbi:MAG TPA: GGDEF domain-containing protein [Candidatus Paceibacterota bacterium]